MAAAYNTLKKLHLRTTFTTAHKATPDTTERQALSHVPACNTIDASKITSGVLTEARIPNLGASKITSGTLSSSRTPSLDASKIVSGTLHSSRIPSLDPSKITTGTFPGSRISHGTNASNITTGTLSSAQLPDIAASDLGTTLRDNIRNPARCLLSKIKSFSPKRSR